LLEAETMEEGTFPKANAAATGEAAGAADSLPIL